MSRRAQRLIAFDVAPALAPTLALTLALTLAPGLHGAALAAADDSLPAAVLTALQQAGVAPEALAAVALPLGHRGQPWQVRGTLPMQPGSAMKLVTAVVALDRLGTTHTGSTRLLSAAPQDGTVLRGDLVLQGGGDPSLGLPQLWALLVDLRDRGITRIEGDLLLDRQRYRPARLDVGAAPFDERPEGWWNVIPDALLLSDGLQNVELVSDAASAGVSADKSVSARLRPAVQGVRLDTTALALNERPCSDWDADWLPPRTAADPQQPGGVVVVLQGSFPRHCRRVEGMQVVERNTYTGLVFAQLWRELGGQWAGGVREAAAPAAARVLAERRAPPWGEVLRPLLKTSDNTLARMLFLELGVPAMAAAPQAQTIDLARDVVQHWFTEKGLPTQGLVVDNGSGLSRTERIQALALARLLEWAWHSRLAPDLLMALPVAGVDGTLRNRLKDSAASGSARLKTGTLRNVAALAGVVNDAQGRPWALVAIVNHDIGAGARPVLDALVDDFARRGPYRPSIHHERHQPNLPRPDSFTGSGAAGP